MTKTNKMAKTDWNVGALQPDDILIIDTVETLRVVADPLRLQILELLRGAPHTVKQLAAALRTPLKKLYYHLQCGRDRQWRCARPHDQ